MVQAARSIWGRMAPALFLALMAPAMAELLPGATRFSSLFVFPIELAVWGGGAVLIRYLVRQLGLGWPALTLLALALAVAEECLIQQTSLAPMVIHLKGEVYARAFGVNYVYLLWALPYEAVFVVLLPVQLAELVFADRRGEPWVSRAGLIAAILLFGLGSRLAWFTWTQIARPKVFHLPPFTPPVPALAVAALAIALLAFLALGPFRQALSRPARALAPPPAPVVGLLAAVWAILWYGLALLGFGIAPALPPARAIGPALLSLALILWLAPRWAADPRWSAGRRYALVFGAMLGSMAAGFIGFLGPPTVDLWFKLAIDALAVALMVWLGLSLRRPTPLSPAP
jgi:hypothetical protein